MPWRRRRRFRLRGSHGHFCCEAVAELRHGLDPDLLVGLAKGAAQVGDDASDHRLIHMSVLPNGSEELVAIHQFTGVIQQQQQGIERLWRKRHGRAGAPQEPFPLS